MRSSFFSKARIAATGENLVPRAIPYEITVLDFDEIKHANSNEPAYFSSLR